MADKTIWKVKINIFERKIKNIFLPIGWNICAQKIETVLLNTHTICFGWKIRNLIFCYHDTLILGPVNLVFQISDPSARSIQVQNLWPYTTYHLRLIAENIVGRSSASVPTRPFQTLQDAPAVLPGNVTARALNATALIVSWKVTYIWAQELEVLSLYHF